MVITLNKDQLKNIILLVISGELYQFDFFKNFSFQNEMGEEVWVGKEGEAWIVKIGGEVVASNSWKDSKIWVAEGWDNEVTKEVLGLWKERNRLVEEAGEEVCSFKKCLLDMLHYSIEGCYSWTKNIDCGGMYTTIEWNDSWNDHVTIVREGEKNGKLKKMGAINVSKKGVEIFPYFKDQYQVKALKSFLEGELEDIFNLLKKEKELKKRINKVQIGLGDFIDDRGGKAYGKLSQYVQKDGYWVGLLTPVAEWPSRPSSPFWAYGKGEPDGFRDKSARTGDKFTITGGIKISEEDYNSLL